MKLLDAAEVKTGTGDWTRGWDSEERGCGNVVVYLQHCDTAVAADVVGDSNDLDHTDTDCGYRVIPFGIVAALVRNTRAGQEDDGDWLRKALREAAEIPVSRGLLLQQADGDTWIGNASVDEVPAPTLTDKAAVQKAVTDSRALFFSKTFALEPILHVNPGAALALKDAGVITLDPVTGDDRTAWGDKVVISEGYNDIPDLTAVPIAFWTGPITITLSEVNEEDLVRTTLQNKVMHQATLVAAIDAAPCAMVRIGAAPAPVA